jgi:hypothetical protein
MSGGEAILLGSAIGAATNRKNPIQGAMLGGFLGGAGNAMFPSIGSALSTSAPASGILPSAASGSVTVATNPALVTSSLPTSATNVGFQTAAQQAAAQMPTNIANEAAKGGLFAAPKGGFQSLTNPAMQGQGLAQTAAIQRPLTYGMEGVEYGQGGSPTMMERFGAVGKYAQQNPVLSQMAMQGAQSLLQQQPQQPAPAGLMRGSPSQVQMPQYQVGVPKVSLI